MAAQTQLYTPCLAHHPDDGLGKSKDEREYRDKEIDKESEELQEKRKQRIEKFGNPIHHQNGTTDPWQAQKALY